MMTATMMLQGCDASTNLELENYVHMYSPDALDELRARGRLRAHSSDSEAGANYIVQ